MTVLFLEFFETRTHPLSIQGPILVETSAIRLMVIACTKEATFFARDLESLPSAYHVRSGYGGRQTTARIGSLFVVHDVAQLADPCTSGAFYFGIPVLAVDHRNPRNHHKPSHRVVIEPHCRPTVGLAIRRWSDV